MEEKTYIGNSSYITFVDKNTAKITKPARKPGKARFIDIPIQLLDFISNFTEEKMVGDLEIDFQFQRMDETNWFVQRDQIEFGDISYVIEKRDQNDERIP